MSNNTENRRFRWKYIWQCIELNTAYSTEEFQKHYMKHWLPHRVLQSIQILRSTFYQWKTDKILYLDE